MFIGGLNPETKSSIVEDYFSFYGEVEVVRIIGEKKKKSRGYGFLTFQLPENLTTALDSQPHTIDGNVVDCHNAAENREKNKKSDPNCKLYLKGVDPEITKGNLFDYFNTFGKVKEVLLVHRKNKE